MADIFWPFPPEDVIEWPGARGWTSDHIGTDWPVPQGTRLRAAVSGVVDIIWDDGLGAWVIDIYTPDGWVIRNGHLSAMSPADGQWVNAGDDIGATGGRPGTAGAGFSTGDHFHWEIRNNPGWGAFGWYDPRTLNIKTFGEDEMTPEQEKRIMARIDAVVEKTVKGVLDTKIKQKGSKLGGTTTLRSSLAWNDHQWASTKRPLEWITRWGDKIRIALGVK